MMDHFLSHDLEGLSGRGLRRNMRVTEGPQARAAVIDGNTVLNFCSNDYLGLASDPRLVQAFKDAAAVYGFGAGASRLVCGSMPPHAVLENALAALKGTEAGLVFSSGYAANTGVIPAVIGRDDIVFCDKLNHASIIDGMLLSRAEVKRYPHAQLEALEDGLKAAGRYRHRLILTDSVFSMDGDRAPLKEIAALARRYDAWLMVDEAHGFGVLGERGGGLAQELGLEKEIDIHMGTLSKAAGCIGAYVCGSSVLREYLIHHARSFIYSTAMLPGAAAAALAAVGIIQDPQDGGERRRKVADHADRLRTALKALGFNTLASSTPIIPVVVGDASEAVGASQKLLDQGIFVQAIRPPTVPQGTSRLRITVTAQHTSGDIDRLIAAMKLL